MQIEEKTTGERAAGAVKGGISGGVIGGVVGGAAGLAVASAVASILPGTEAEAAQAVTGVLDSAKSYAIETADYLTAPLNAADVNMIETMGQPALELADKAASLAGFGIDAEAAKTLVQGVKEGDTLLSASAKQVIESAKNLVEKVDTKYLVGEMGTEIKAGAAVASSIQDAITTAGGIVGGGAMAATGATMGATMGWADKIKLEREQQAHMQHVKF